jgi:hypothetical protein
MSIYEVPVLLRSLGRVSGLQRGWNCTYRGKQEWGDPRRSEPSQKRMGLPPLAAPNSSGVFTTKSLTGKVFADNWRQLDYRGARTRAWHALWDRVDQQRRSWSRSLSHYILPKTRLSLCLFAHCDLFPGCFQRQVCLPTTDTSQLTKRSKVLWLASKLTARRTR